jgi:hypothetical protein
MRRTLADAKRTLADVKRTRADVRRTLADVKRTLADSMPSGESVLEIRPIFEAEGFGKELTPELRAQEQRLRAEIERQRKS